MSPHSVELWTDKIQACLEGERAAAQAVGELLSQDRVTGLLKLLWMLRIHSLGEHLPGNASPA